VNNAIISNKLKNYSRIKGVLRVKIVLNASPFYYGALRACYDPMNHNDFLDGTDNDQIPFSQMPGVWLFPQQMTTAEMTLPFLWPSNWLDLTDNALFAKIGNLRFILYSQLQSANGVSGSGVTVSVYAHMEQVELMGPSVVAILQSDEYEVKDGAVSGPASKVAQAAGKLKSVPVIGSMASATEMGANMVADIAKIFGYSNPPNIRDVEPYQPKAFHAFASTEIKVPIDKLAIDPKNEITIDPETVNDDEDNLAFSNLLTRDSFILGTQWTGSQPQDTILFSAAVSPMYNFSVAHSFASYVCNTPLGFAGEMFARWRGSLVYTFKFVKTKYHTGRVAITWDPEMSSNTYASDQTVNFTRIVDLQSEDVVEVIIPYKSISPWLTANRVGFISNGTSPSITYSAASNNGILRVRVLNALTAPAASPSINVLVSMRAGDDFRYAVPVDISSNIHHSTIQSAEEVIADAPADVAASMEKLTNGEALASIRPLILRSQLFRIQPVLKLGTPTTYSTGTFVPTTSIVSLQRLQPLSGYTLNTISYDYSTGTLTGGNKKFNFVSNTPLNLLAPCFVGQRGSMNYHITLDALNSVGASVSKVLSVSRDFINSPTVSSTTAPIRNVSVSNDTDVGVLQTLPSEGGAGMSVTYTDTQGAISVNLPQMSRVRFLDTRDPTIIPDVAEVALDYFKVTTRLSGYTATFDANTRTPHINIYSSAGTDFSFVYFVCVPRYYSYANPLAFAPGAT
jgi:hypothetical protein